MAERAGVESVDGIKHLRVSIIKFIETANVALADAESEVSRTLIWLENEARSYWEGQVRKRHENVEKCKEAVRMKKVFKDSAGRQQSAVDEEKALVVAQRMLAEAVEKSANVKRYTRVLQKEMQMYKGGVARLNTNVSSQLAQGVAELGNVIETLEAYTGLQMEAPSGTPQSIESAGGMSRTVDDEMPPAKPPEEVKKDEPARNE